MIFPRAWSRLPGVSDYIEGLVTGLAEQRVVVAGLADYIANEVFADEVADVVARRHLGRWHVVKSREAASVQPISAIVRRRTDASEGGRLVLWVDAGSETAMRIWADYMSKAMRSSECPRVLISTLESMAGRDSVSDRLSTKRWSSYVTKTDCGVLAERAGRRSGSGPFHIALKRAIVAELADGNLQQAEALSQHSLERLVGMEEGQQGVWAGQVGVLMPLIERERQSVLRQYSRCWRLPHVLQDGKTISCLQGLEIGDLASQSESVSGVPRAAIRRIRWPSRVRNALAHVNVVPWGTLINPTARTVADFR